MAQYGSVIIFLNSKTFKRSLAKPFGAIMAAPFPVIDDHSFFCFPTTVSHKS